MARRPPPLLNFEGVAPRCRPASRALLYSFSLLLSPLPPRPLFLFHPYFSPFNLPSSEENCRLVLPLFSRVSPFCLSSLSLPFLSFFLFLCWREIYFGRVYVKIRENQAKLWDGRGSKTSEICRGIGGPRRGSFERGD